MSSLPLLGSGSQQRTFPFLWVPKLSLASATSFSQQQLTTSEPQLLSDSPTHQPPASPDLSCLQHLSMDHTENTVPLLLFMGCCLVKAIACSNGCCTVAYFAVIASNRSTRPSIITGIHPHGIVFTLPLCTTLPTLT
jgi:hypothetical protein